MQDLQGPRIAWVNFRPKDGVLPEGETVIFSTKKERRESDFCGYPKLHSDMKTGELIILRRRYGTRCPKISGSRITARVARGGTLYSRKA